MKKKMRNDPNKGTIHQRLTDIEKHLVDTYLTCHNARETSKIINRSYHWVNEHLNADYIEHEISMRQDDNANRADITNEWLLTQIKETAIAAKADQSWGAALKGFELLAKINGMFDDTAANGISYNVMGSVIIAPDAQSAQKLLENPQASIEGEYKVLDFNVGEDLKE